MQLPFVHFRKSIVGFCTNYACECIFVAPVYATTYKPTHINTNTNTNTNAHICAHTQNVKINVRIIRHTHSPIFHSEFKYLMVLYWATLSTAYIPCLSYHKAISMEINDLMKITFKLIDHIYNKLNL